MSITEAALEHLLLQWLAELSRSKRCVAVGDYLCLI